MKTASNVIQSLNLKEILRLGVLLGESNVDFIRHIMMTYISSLADKTVIIEDINSILRSLIKVII
jgi:hypothetical protein